MIKLIVGIAVLAAVFWGFSAMVNSEGDGLETIKPEQAKLIMDSGEKYVLLDVRTRDEYKNDGHIKNAILVPDFELSDKAATVIPSKDSLVLVYCRSGRRSLKSAKLLVSMGYTNVKDIGGIINWPYEVEK